jgi:hypothetical protein
MKLPIVKGRNLKRQKIDEGVPFVEQLAQETPGFHYYEFPTLPREGAYLSHLSQ